MDLLGEVTKSSKKLAQAEEKYLEAMRARNEAIRAARADRFGPGVIGGAADLTPEQVRRICNAADPTPAAATRPPRQA
jgi:hypothetical protein